jgi:hypothetical protein
MEIFREILEIVLTGLSASVFLGLWARWGMIPIFYLTQAPKPKEEDKE